MFVLPPGPGTTKVLRPPALCSPKRYTRSLTAALHAAAASAPAPAPARASDFCAAKAWWGKAEFLLLEENFPVWHSLQLCSCSPEAPSLELRKSQWPGAGEGAGGPTHGQRDLFCFLITVCVQCFLVLTSGVPKGFTSRGEFAVAGGGGVVDFHPTTEPSKAVCYGFAVVRDFRTINFDKPS